MKESEMKKKICFEMSGPVAGRDIAMFVYCQGSACAAWEPEYDTETISQEYPGKTRTEECSPPDTDSDWKVRSFDLCWVNNDNLIKIVWVRWYKSDRGDCGLKSVEQEGCQL